MFIRFMLTALRLKQILSYALIMARLVIFYQTLRLSKKILIPEIREKLKALHEGSAAEFENFLKDYFFDLHYQPKPNALPINLGLGHLWRLAVDHPTQQVLPCVHRAPVESDGEYRLLLIC
jgi:hypothetical protein